LEPDGGDWFSDIQDDEHEMQEQWRRWIDESGRVSRRSICQIDARSEQTGRWADDRTPIDPKKMEEKSERLVLVGSNGEVWRK
jgi:hypothetical protein